MRTYKAERMKQQGACKNVRRWLRWKWPGQRFRQLNHTIPHPSSVWCASQSITSAYSRCTSMPTIPHTRNYRAQPQLLHKGTLEMDGTNGSMIRSWRPLLKLAVKQLIGQSRPDTPSITLECQSWGAAKTHQRHMCKCSDLCNGVAPVGRPQMAA